MVAREIKRFKFSMLKCWCVNMILKGRNLLSGNMDILFYFSFISVINPKFSKSRKNKNLYVLITHRWSQMIMSIPNNQFQTSWLCYLMDAYSACVLTYRSSSESWPGQPEAECGVVPWRARCWDQQASRCQTQTERTVLMTEKRSHYFNQRKECGTLTLFPLPEEASAWPSTPYEKEEKWRRWGQSPLPSLR